MNIKKIPLPLFIFFILMSLTIVLGVIFLILANTNGNGDFTNIIFPQTKTMVADEMPVVITPKYPPSLPIPKKVKGIYLTGYTFANKKLRDNLVKLIEKTELNSFVIDIKDSAGRLMFTPKSKFLQNIPVSKMSISNEEHKKILSELQEKQIYTIARITTFQDSMAVKTFPDLALKNKWGKIWKNWQGISWLDMTNPKSWEIPVEQAREAALLGYDEIQFDYIRFPSDGNIRQIKYYNLPLGKRKYEILQKFYSHIGKELAELNIPLSIDLFGLTYERRKDPHYDMNIGQRLIDVTKYFDYISPMVYPSHYPEGYLGFSNPATHPYTVIDWAMKAGNSILHQATSTAPQTRPWLQDFDMGANYDAPMVRAQIKASEKNNTAGWLLWNPYNHYTIRALKTMP